jgi:DNA-binding cell septation regulator SpoVG
MKISIEHHGDQFNVALSTAEGKEPCITVKGCRIRESSDGPFVSWPSRKMDNGKFWSHVYASRAFGDAVLQAYNRSQGDATKPAAKRPPKPAPKPSTGFDDMDDDVPF